VIHKHLGPPRRRPFSRLGRLLGRVSATVGTTFNSSTHRSSPAADVLLPRDSLIVEADTQEPLVIYRPLQVCHPWSVLQAALEVGGVLARNPSTLPGFSLPAGAVQPVHPPVM